MDKEHTRQIERYEALRAAGKLDPVGAVELGKRYREAGDLPKAEEIFKGILAKDPVNEQAYFEMGNIAHMRGDLTNASCYYRAALRINPASVWAAGELAKIYILSSDLDGAQAFCEKMLKEQPRNAALKVELGKVYRLRGRCTESLTLFKEALALDPGRGDIDDFIARTGEVNGFRAETLPCRVFITWGMHYACNYDCSYCYTPRPGSPTFKQGARYAARYPGTKEVLQAWEKVRARYGACRIRLDGGEPSAYPDFMNVVTGLSAMHRLQINTNLSFDVPSFVKAIDPGRVRIDASLHSEHTPLDEFAGKVQRLKDHGFKVVVSFVAYPPFIDRIPVCRERFAALQVPFIIHPFSGRYNGTAYPAGYTEEETKRIYTLDKASDTARTWRAVHQDRAQTQDAGPRSEETGNEQDVQEPEETMPAAPAHGGPVRVCRMGQMYARIYPNGDAYRCCTDDGLLSLGNLFDGNFALLDEPASCDHPGCRCWRCMTPGDEKRWLHTWLDDWEMPR